MKETVYIETSVISYLTSRPSRDIIIAGRQEITRDKWQNICKEFDTYISFLVIQEARYGDSEAAQKRSEIIEKMPALKIDEAAEILADKLLKEKAIPSTSVKLT